ncbi:RICIN domain-containing protein [Frankia sp. AgB1.9]
MAGLLAAGVVFAGQASAIPVPPPDDPPPNPVQWSLISDVSGQCLDVYKVSLSVGGAMTTRPCNGSSTQKFQTIYGSGFAQIRDVNTQFCVAVTSASDPTPGGVYQGNCGSSIFVHWTPVSGPNGSTQWRNQSDGLCLGVPVSSIHDILAYDRSCADTGTYWHFG